MKNPLVVVLGIGEYDGNTFHNLIGVARDYFNIKYVFNHIRGYSIVYQTSRNRIRYINQATRCETDVIDIFKLRWTEEEIEEFNDYIADNILCNNPHSDSDDSKSNSDKLNEDTINEKHDGLIYFISCHGNREYVIYDSEGEEFNLSFLFDQFDNENCPYLRKMPKIYFLDCCRGSLKSKRKDDDTYTNDENESKDDEKQEITKGGQNNKRGKAQDRTYIKDRDIYKVFANTDGHATVDGGMTGGYLIQSVAKAFHKNRIFNKEFEDICNHVSKIMLTAMGKSVNSAVNVMECQTTIDYPVKFQAK